MRYWINGIKCYAWGLFGHARIDVIEALASQAKLISAPAEKFLSPAQCYCVLKLY